MKLEFLVIEFLKIFFVLCTIKNVLITVDAIKNHKTIKGMITNADIMWLSLYIVSAIAMFNF